MNFQVTEIEFDFTDDLDYDKLMSTVWEVDDEDDLVEEITCATGWYIKSIDYRHVLV